MKTDLDLFFSKEQPDFRLLLHKLHRPSRRLHRGPWQEGQCRSPQIKPVLLQVWFLQDVTRKQRAESSVIDIFLQRFCFSKISLANDKVTEQIHHLFSPIPGCTEPIPGRAQPDPLFFKPCHYTNSTQGFTTTNAINIPVLDFKSLPHFQYYFLS